MRQRDPVLLAGTVAEADWLANRIDSGTGLRVLRVAPDDVARWAETRCSAIVTALHPFDAPGRARIEAAAPGPVMHWLRPCWGRTAQDRWIAVRDMRSAMTAARALRARRVVVTTGRDKLGPLLHEPPARLFIRVRGRVPPLSHRAVTWCPDRGPFTVEQERRTLARLRIDALIVHDAGGHGAFPKIAAARRLRLPVIVLSRPPEPAAMTLRQILDALRRGVDGERPLS